MKRSYLTYFAFVSVFIILIFTLIVVKQSLSIQNMPLVSVTPTVQPQVTVTSVPTPTDRPPTPMPTKVKRIGSYGIAAGGVLLSLDQNDLNHYFDQLKSLGVTWVRWDIDWRIIQRNGPDSYDWSDTDRVAETAKRYGINSLGTIGYTPKWASDPACNNGIGCEPTDPMVFGTFSKEVAVRYKDSVKFWEIWNEPNYPVFWGPTINPGKYADVLKEAFTEIKRVSPQSVVMVGGLAITGKDASSPLTFIKTLYSLGADKYFDAVAIHPYTYPISPKNQAEWNGWQQMISVHKFLVSKSDSVKKIWITEYGAPTGGPGSVQSLNQLKFTYGSDFVSEVTQKQLLEQVIPLYNQISDWTGPFFWHSLRDNGTSPDTPENFFGLLRFDWSKKPAYDVFRSAINP